MENNGKRGMSHIALTLSYISYVGSSEGKKQAEGEK